MRVILFALLLFLTPVSVTQAYIITSDTLDAPVYMENSWAGYSSNYANNYGLTFNDRVVTGVKGFYISACAVAYPTPTMTAYWANETDDVVLATTTVSLPLCSSYASTTNNYADYAFADFSHVAGGVRVGSDLTDRYVLTVRGSSYNHQVYYELNDLPASGDWNDYSGPIWAACTGWSDDQYVCNDGVTRHVGYALDTEAGFVVGEGYEWDPNFHSDTRFIDASFQSPQNNIVNFSSTYYLNVDEYNNETRPDVLNVWIFDDDGMQIHTQRKIILPISTGTSTRAFDINYNFPDGTYTAQVNFWNMQTNYFTQKHTQVTVEFVISNDDVVSSQVIQISDSETLPEASANSLLGQCGLDNLTACLVAPFLFLFQPSPDTVDNFLDTIQSTDNLMIGNAITAFNNVTSVKDATPDGNQLVYRLQIAEAGVDVEMLSINTITQLFGDSAPMFRGIMILVIWLGFFSMMISSVWSRFTPGDSYDFVPDATGTGAKRARDNTYVSHR